VGAAAVAAVCALTVLAACGDGGSSGGSGGDTDANGVTTITYGTVTPTANTVNLLVAVDQGFFTQNKINMVVKPLSNATTVLAGLGTDYDIATGFTPQEIIGRQQGLDVVVISGGTYDDAQHPGSGVVVTESSGINDLQGLTGKTVGCVGLTNAIFQAFQYQLRQQHVDAATIKGVAVPSATQQGQLAAGQISAAIGTYPFITSMKNAGMKDLGDPLRAVGDRVSLTNFVAPAAWAKNNPDAISRFRKALDEANQWMADNPDKVPAILVKYTGTPEEAAKTAPLPGYTTDFTAADVDQWMTVLKSVVPNFSSTLTYAELAPEFG
jgi:ABC-type nitrate/sulfonate/bicarbonate transport system substrate-binding protein